MRLEFSQHALVLAMGQRGLGVALVRQVVHQIIDRILTRINPAECVRASVELNIFLTLVAVQIKRNGWTRVSRCVRNATLESVYIPCMSTPRHRRSLRHKRLVRGLGSTACSRGSVVPQRYETTQTNTTPHVAEYSYQIRREHGRICIDNDHAGSGIHWQ